MSESLETTEAEARDYAKEGQPCSGVNKTALKLTPRHFTPVAHVLREGYSSMGPEALIKWKHDPVPPGTVLYVELQ